VTNRKISEFSPINGVNIVDQDLLTLVDVFEVDPVLRNKKITFTEFRNYLDQYYLTGSGGVFSDNVLINGNLTVTGTSSFTSVTGLNLATFSGVVVQNNLTATGTISGNTITGTTVGAATATAVNGEITTLTGTTVNYTTANLQSVNAGTHAVSGNSTVTGTLGVSGTVTFAGNAAISGTLSGTTVTGTTAQFTTGTFTSLTGTTITGTTVNTVTTNATTVTSTTGSFTSLTGTTVTGISGQFTNVSGTTVTGTTANFTSGNYQTVSGVTGVFTTTLSGATITGNTVNATTGNFGSVTGVTIVGTTSVSGATITGTTVLATTGSFTSLTGTTATGVTARFTTGTFTSLTGTTTTGVTATYTTGSFTSLTGVTTTGTTANFTSGNFQNLSGTTITGTTVNATSGVFQDLFAVNQTFGGNLTFSGDTSTLGNATIASGLTVTGTISGTTITGTTVLATTGSFVSLTGTTTTGVTAQFTTGTFTSLTGTTTSGTTASFTTGTFTSLTGTTTTGVTAQFTTGTFTSLTGTTTSGTTASFVTGTFTSLTGTTASGTTAWFTTGTFTSLTGTTTTGVTSTYTTGSFTSLTGATTTGTTASFTSGNFQTVSGVTVIGSTTVSGATVTGTTANFTSGNFSNIISSAATMSGSLIMANQQQVRFREAVGNGVNHIALQAPAIVSADQTITLPDQTGTVVTTGDNGSVTSTMILDGTILNADINASAAIALSKLATGALPTGITVASGNIVDGTITNADINASAAIVDTKLATISTAGKVSGSAITSGIIATSGSIEITNTIPAIRLTESDGTSTHNKTLLNRNSDTFIIGTRDSTDSPVSADYSIPSNASGATDHIWRIANTEKARLNSTGLTVANDLTISDKIIPAGDTNTAIRFPAVDTVTVETNGSERARIDSSGRLLVGTSSAVSVNSITAGLELHALATTNGASASIARFSNDNTGPQLNFGKSRNGGTLSPGTVVQNNDFLGDISFCGDDGTDINSRAARIGCEVDGTPGANDMPGRLIFSTTADGNASPTERLRITSAGNVGIGTTSPSVGLQVQDDSSFSLIRVVASSSSVAGIDFGDTADNDVGGVRYDNVTDSMAFRVNASERARIDSSGRLLVGTSTTTALTTLLLQGNSTSSSGASFIKLARGVNTPGASDALGSVEFSDNGHTNAAIIRADRDGGTWTSGSSQPARLVFSTTADGAAIPTERLRITSAGVLQVADAGNITVGTTTGTKIGTGTTQKLGFYNATPVVQPTAVANATDAATVITQLNALLTRMRNLGLIAT
jgi:hypothetical protein